MKPLLRGLSVGAAMLAAVVGPGCADETSRRAAIMTGGDPALGRQELRHHGCGACHTIPGVPGATSLVGPPLDHLARRSYLAGILPNNPTNLREWIMHPQRYKPHNAMPDLGVTEASARHMAAHLYTLE